MRLGRHHYGCLHSTGSTAVEELHLPTKTNRESRRWRDSRTVISGVEEKKMQIEKNAHAPRGKENDVILKEKASHVTDYCESVEDVTTAHFYPLTLWFVPAHC